MLIHVLILLNSSSISTSNSYAPLKALVDEDERASKSPPIYVKNVELQACKTLISRILSTITDEFECRVTNKNGVTSFQDPRTFIPI